MNTTDLQPMAATATQKNRGNMILFLDIDGVLHPAVGRDDSLFCCLEHLWEILRARPSVDVVISSSWREHYAFDDIVGCLTQNGGNDLKTRFIGQTPSFFWNAEARANGSVREAECRAWLHENVQDQDQKWLAIDDSASHFSRFCPELYRANPATGLVPADIHNILVRIPQRGFSADSRG